MGRTPWPALLRMGRRGEEKAFQAEKTAGAKPRRQGEIKQIGRKAKGPERLVFRELGGGWHEMPDILGF